jgi:ADP-ribose pyrophosphatase YjhB (NUDIX family)
MTKLEHPLSQEEFDSIYAKVPRLTVEIIVRDADSALYLTKRAIELCKGQWHLPGGTVRFGEPMTEAVKRIAKRELGIDVKLSKNIGYIEYPSHYLRGLDSPVGIVFEIKDYSGEFVANEESSNASWFKYVPPRMHADQDNFLIKNNYLVSA